MEVSTNPGPDTNPQKIGLKEGHGPQMIGKGHKVLITVSSKPASCQAQTPLKER